MAATNPPQSPTQPESNRGCARSAGRITAGALALALILTLPLSLLAFDWARLFFDPEHMAQVVGQQLIDSGVLREMAMQTIFPSDPGQGELRFRQFQQLDPAARERLLDILIPRGWGQEQVTRIVTDLYAWFDNDQPRPALSLDIGPLKERLITGGAQELVTLLVDSWPDCTPEQIEQLGGQLLGSQEFPEELMCHPPEPLRTGLIDQSTRFLLDGVQPIPAVLPLSEAGGPSSVEDVGRLKQGIRLVRAQARWGWLLPLSTLGLIAAVVARSWPQLLRWWGVPLAGAGGTGLALLFGAVRLAQRLTERTLAQSQFPPFMAQALLGVGDKLRDDILGALLFQSILLLLAGAALWGIGAYLGRRRTAAA
ncbi:MAG TPA: hypothetical protein VGA07_09510 [Anaerolineales bacterium]